jgi:hypothetical protein
MADNVNVTPSGTTPIATDDINGVQFQKVKHTLGDDGQDAGTVSNTNPLPTDLVGVFKRLFQVFGRMGFDSTSSLRVMISNTPAVTVSSGTVTTVSAVTTVSTVTTGNIGLGDIGKPATAQMMSTNTFYGSIGANFKRA